MADNVRLNGVAASEGVAVGPAFVHVPRELKPERESISKDAVEEELGQFPKRRRNRDAEALGDGGAVARGR